MHENKVPIKSIIDTKNALNTLSENDGNLFSKETLFIELIDSVGSNYIVFA